MSLVDIVAQVETPAGMVDVTATDLNHMYVHAGTNYDSNPAGITLRGKPYMIGLHCTRAPGGPWHAADSVGNRLRRTDVFPVQPASVSVVGVFEREVLPAILAWAEKQEEVFLAAWRNRLLRDLERNQQEIWEAADTLNQRLARRARILEEQRSAGSGTHARPPLESLVPVEVRVLTGPLTAEQGFELGLHLASLLPHLAKVLTLDWLKQNGLPSGLDAAWALTELPENRDDDA